MVKQSIKAEIINNVSALKTDSLHHNESVLLIYIEESSLIRNMYPVSNGAINTFIAIFLIY